MPMRRSSATSGDAPRSTIRPCSSRTSLATTTSPGRSDGSRPPATPATTRASGTNSARRGSQRRTRSGPMPQRSTTAPGTRPTSAAYSVRSAATTTKPAIAPIPSRRGGPVPPPLAPLGRIHGPAPRLSARAASRRRGSSRERSSVGGHLGSSLPRYVASEGADREEQAVHLVVDVEVAGEAGSCVEVLVPATVLALRADKVLDTSGDRQRLLLGGQQREQRPGGL